MSVFDNDESAGAHRLRQLTEESLHDRPGRHLDDVLADLVAAAADIVTCEQVTLTVLGPHGFTENSAAFGVAADDAHELDVPLVLRGRPSGSLSLAAAAPFGEAQERDAVSIAGAAANLIEKARTVAENSRRSRWLNGATDLVREIAAGRHREPLKLVTERLLEVADAELAYVVQPGANDDTVVVTTAAGRNAEQWDGYVLPAGSSVAAEVLRTGEPRNLVEVPEGMLPEGLRTALGIDAVLLVPLRGTHANRGVLAMGRSAGRRPFTVADLGMATMFAGQVALALELADVQARRDQLALVDERDRIARDLHDHVIQRLFAVGLTLQSAGLQLDGRTADQIHSSIDDIDDTIKQIRSTIYRLTQPIVSPNGSIRAQATRLLDDLERPLGFRPSLTFDGPVDFGIDDDVIDDAVAVLRESVTNIARHAGATRADVAVQVAGGALTMQIRDDGRGIGDTTRRSGLANMRTRAERRGGSLDVETGYGDGTALTWSVPLAADTPARVSD